MMPLYQPAIAPNQCSNHLQQSLHHHRHVPAVSHDGNQCDTMPYMPHSCTSPLHSAYHDNDDFNPNTNGLADYTEFGKSTDSKLW